MTFSTTTFEITERNGIIYFSVDEDDFSGDEMSWHSSEVFTPALDELTKLYFDLGDFLDQKGVMSHR